MCVIVMLKCDKELKEGERERVYIGGEKSRQLGSGAGRVGESAAVASGRGAHGEEFCLSLGSNGECGPEKDRCEGR
jgi:hypothetical protein